jgi:hypothetical protein
MENKRGVASDKELKEALKIGKDNKEKVVKIQAHLRGVSQ